MTIEFDPHSQFEERADRVLTDCIEGYDRLVACDRLSGGANQETYRLVFSDVAGTEKSLAMRRAVSGSADKQQTINVGIATEARLFQVAQANGVPSPEIIHVLKPEDELGEGFIMTWLDGESFGSRIVHDPVLATIRPQLADQCGRILARIHSIDLKASGLDQILATTTTAEFVEDTWARYRVLETPQPMIDFTARWLLKNLPDAPRTTLVHNDFRNGNLMIDSTGIIGVLDWEIAHIGDPIRDLGWLCTNSWRFGKNRLPVGGFGDYDSLIAGYEAGSGKRIERKHLRFWEVFGSFWWAIGCLSMADQHREGPDRSVERAAIGRRSSECQTDCVNLLIPGPVELVKPTTAQANSDLPRNDELIDSVREFLHGDVMEATHGRIRFLSRVAGNSLDIVKRELALGPLHIEVERQSLCALFGSNESLDALRWKLVNRLRNCAFMLEFDEITSHLRNTVINRLAIDQPNYSGFKTALQNSK